MLSQGLNLLRIAIILSVLALAFLSQRYWFVRAWRLASRVRQPIPRCLLRGMCGVAFVLVVLAVIATFSLGFRFTWRHSAASALAGLWFSSALFAYLAVQAVVGGGVIISWLWRQSRSAAIRTGRGTSGAPGNPEQAEQTNQPEQGATVEVGEVSLPRRRFLQTSTILAGAIPFAGAVYGFAFERLSYQVRQVDLPIAGLPPALVGMRIAQLSDIHIGSYMSASEVRRAVGMTNELGADLAVVTGDFITGADDPLEACITELSQLRAPLGVWGCNGNHEIYADVEDLAGRLFARHGMRLLRQENAQLVWNGHAINLIGVDYQRQGSTLPASPSPVPGLPRRGSPMLRSIEPLVRHDVPNILLSHNPNSFPRAARLGIELMLTGHTHGGQVRVEILDHRFTPARFFTPYAAGLYSRPLRAAGSFMDDKAAWAAAPASPSALVYVNRGLGTIGAPIRLGVPPEISLLTLRRA